MENTLKDKDNEISTLNNNMQMLRQYYQGNFSILQNVYNNVI